MLHVHRSSNKSKNKSGLKHEGLEPKIGSGSSGSVFIAGSASSVPNGSGFWFPGFLKERLHYGVLAEHES